MKIKCAILLLIMTLLCGCATVQDESIDNILSRLADSSNNANTYHTGFKYYVPSSMSVTEYILFNDTIESDKFTFYLYADAISYYNKTQSTYEINDDAYYSAIINIGDKFGYIEINLKDNNQYLIEIMYNYAKIEVMVDDENDINLALIDATSILRSVQYNDVVIANLLGEDVLTFQEEEYNMFEKVGTESNYLKYREAETEDVKDTGNTGTSYRDTDLLN